MGSQRESSSSQSSQSTQYTPTAEETEFNKLQLAQAKEFDPIQRELNAKGGNLINKLLSGDSNLPGFLAKLPAGISPEVTQGIVDQSLRDINTQMRASGAGTFMESGAAQSIGARTSGDIRRAAEEFNIGTLFNLLNLGVGGQAQVQQPILSTSNMLSQRLAGLRSVNQTGTMTSQTRRSYDFFTSPFTTAMAGGTGQGAGAAAMTVLMGCWVAAEVFGGWDKLKTRFARIFIMTRMPKWFRGAYLKYGERFANFISDKPALKASVKPVFEVFALGGRYGI